MTAATPLSPSAIPHCKIAILGTGFSGLGMAIRLKQAGENDFLLLEKEAGVGGTWRVNHYPGCACDVQSHLYSFSFAPNPEWSRMFAPQPEIKRYLEDCWERFGLAPHTQLNTELCRLSWNESSQHWLIETRDGKQFSARFVVSGMGGLSTPAFPSIKGLKTFKGKLFHSQQWDHDYDLSGKRVAVIGTGASAIQFVPQIQPRVGQLDLYQRTPPWIMPKPDRAISERERRLFRRHPALQKLWRGGIYSFLEARVLGFAISPQILRLASLVARHHLRKQIRDILDDIYREAEDTAGALAGHAPGGAVVGGAGRHVSRGKGPVPETRSRGRAVVAETEGMARAQLVELVEELNEQMLAAARELQFEVAARIRDEIAELKKELRAMDAAGR